MLKITPKIYPLILLLAVLTLLSCSDDRHSEKNKNKGTPITFISSEQEETNVSRAATPLNYDFTVYGYKKPKNSGAIQTIFEGYKVKYLGVAGISTDNTHGYAYVGQAANQSIKYWDMAAAGYNFWGYTGDKSGFSSSPNGDGTVLTFTGLKLTTADPTRKDNLFSSLYHRSPVTNDVVRLEFKRPYAKVCVKFHAGEILENDIHGLSELKIEDVTFGPTDPSLNIISQGNLTVTYQKTGNGPETYATADGTGDDHELSFPYPITLTYEHGNTASTAITVPTDADHPERLFYYAVPFAYQSSFTMRAKIEGEVKTAIVPQEMMHWQPNYTYTYIFKILDAGNKIELYDVKIDHWLYGGAQTEEWKNW